MQYMRLKTPQGDFIRIKAPENIPAGAAVNIKINEIEKFLINLPEHSLGKKTKPDRNRIKRSTEIEIVMKPKEKPLEAIIDMKTSRIFLSNQVKSI